MARRIPWPVEYDGMRFARARRRDKCRVEAKPQTTARDLVAPGLATRGACVVVM
jgi:hypothetical protein